MAKTQTEVDPRELKLASAIFGEIEGKILPGVHNLESLLINEAQELVREFRDRRTQLHADLKASQPTPGRRRGAEFYSKLSLFCRYRKGTLQIYWQEVHTNTKSKAPAYRYMRMHTPSGYNIAALKAEAGYAAPLVEEFEDRAAVIRLRWTSVQDIKRGVTYTLLRLPPYASASQVADENGPVPRTHSHLDSLVIAG